MKIFFKFLFFVIAIVFFGWLYIVYLYLHQDNKQTLENIKDDLEKEVRVVSKAVKKETDTISKIVKKQVGDIAEVVSDRQSEMEKFIKSMQKEAFEIKDIAERFKDVSERTLRRDMQRLEKTGLIKQMGSTRNSKYKILS